MIHLHQFAERQISCPKVVGLRPEFAQSSSLWQKGTLHLSFKRRSGQLLVKNRLVLVTTPRNMVR